MRGPGSIVVPDARLKVAAFVAKVQADTMFCRNEHHCNIWPFELGSVVSVLAAALAPKRILELGTALGYATLWLAHGAKDARIDTIESDAQHVALATQNFVEFGIANRVVAHQGEFANVLPQLDPGYDLALFDGWHPELAFLDQFERLIRPGGLLISSNLAHAAYLHGVATEAGPYGDRLYGDGWYTCQLDDNTALSVRR